MWSLRTIASDVSAISIVNVALKLNEVMRDQSRLLYRFTIKLTRKWQFFSSACCSPGETSSSSCSCLLPNRILRVIFISSWCCYNKQQFISWTPGRCLRLNTFQMVSYSPWAMPTSFSRKTLLNRVNTIANKLFFICGVNRRRPLSIFCGVKAKRSHNEQVSRKSRNKRDNS